MGVKRIILPLLLLWPLLMHAQYAAVDWEASRGDSLLPVCSSVVDLPDDCWQYDYTAHIEYPELEKMTAADVRRYSLETVYDSLPAMPAVECYVGVQAKHAQLDVAFLPVVMRGGDYYRINSYKLVVDRVLKPLRSSAAERAAGDRYAANSVLSQGKWVRISVKENGIHRITDSELRRMGFKNPDSVRLFGYGGHILPETWLNRLPDDLQEVPLWREKGYVLFHANGVVKWSYEGGRYVHEQNVYSDYGCYFLTEGGTPMAFPSETIDKKPTATVTVYPDYAVIDNDRMSHCQYGRVLVDDYDYSMGRSVNYKFPISGVASGAGIIDISFATNGNNMSRVALSSAGSTIGTLTIGSCGSGEVGKLASGSYSISGAVADNMVVNLKQSVNDNSVNGYLDYLRLNYVRSLAMRGSQVPFRGNGAAQHATFELDNSTADTRVWSLSGSVPCELKGSLSGNKLSFVAPAGYEDEFVAFDVKGSFPSVQVSGEVPNQNLHAMQQADMVIIIPSDGAFKAAAGRLAAAHREMDGLTVEVVTAQQVYNEFSSGTPDVTAYRRFMKMLYDRAATASEAPKYLLLFGDGWYDNRLRTFPMYRQENYLLCYESLNSVNAVSAYVYEDYMGLLDDAEGENHKRDKVDIGVGRIPATSVDEADAVVDKTIAYMKNGEAGAWQNVVALLGDDGDEKIPNQHMKDAEGIASILEESFPSYIIDRIYWDDFPAEKTATGLRYPEVTKAIRERLDKGALVVNYSGHGSANLISHEMSWKASDMEALTSPRLPFWVTASCDIGPFDKGSGSVAECALFNPVGGAVGLLTTTRTVLQVYNAILNKAFMKRLMSPADGGDAVAVGDAVRMAKCDVVDYKQDLSENKLQFVLLGDPALRLKFPGYRVRVDKVNGVDASVAAQVSAGGLLAVEGAVTTRDNVPVDDFSGILHATLFDCAEDVKTRDNSGLGSFEYTAHNKTLFTGSDSVRGGRFSITMPVPMDISYADAEGLLNFYAADSAAVRMAHGHFNNLIVGGTAVSGDNDGVGPEIKLYLNTPSFMNGGKVNSTPCLCAELYDENGINTVGSGIGHDILAIVDNDPAHTYNLNSVYVPVAGDYKRGTIMLPLNTLEPGEHTLMLRAWDLYNNSSVARISFVVEPGLLPEILDFSITASPVVNGMPASFVVSHNRPQSGVDITLEIFSTQGQLLWRNVDSVVCDGLYYTHSWDGTAAGGRPLSTGVYVARVYMKSDDGVSKPKTLKLVVINNKK